MVQRSPKRSNSRLRPTKLGAQQLEKRELLAALIGYDARRATVTITGSGLADAAEVSQLPSGQYQVKTWDARSQAAQLLPNGLRKIVFYGGDGNDWFKNDTAVPVEAWGGLGDDTLVGGSGNDWLEGQAGNDTLFGGAGNDRLYGWTGDDNLNGGDGDDYIHGWEGADIIFGGNGNDSLWGGLGNDQICGDADNDHIEGQEGDDRLWGGAGDDKLFGWTGNDMIAGGSGDDYLSGWDGDDTLHGEDGRDTLDGGRGTDVGVGGSGLDKYINLTAYPEAIGAGTSYKIDVENGVFIESPYGTPQTTGWSCGVLVRRKM